MQVFYSDSPQKTEDIAKQFAKKLKKGTVIAFFGGLGMGKTTFIRGMIKALEIECDVSSPTFAIVNEYRGKKNSLFHFDMYRINSWDDLYSSGFFDYIDEGEFVAVEWSENIENALPENTVKIIIEQADYENSRKITILADGEDLYDYTGS